MRVRPPIASIEAMASKTMIADRFLFSVKTRTQTNDGIVTSYSAGSFFPGRLAAMSADDVPDFLRTDDRDKYVLTVMASADVPISARITDSVDGCVFEVVGRKLTRSPFAVVEYLYCVKV